MRAAALRLPERLEIRLLDPPGVALMVPLAVSGDLHLQPLGQRVHDTHAHTVEPPRHFVGVLIELPPRMECGHRQLHAGNTLFGVYVDWDPSTIVVDRNGAVLPQRYPYLGAEAGHRLVDGVVDHFVHEVVQSPGGRRSDVHSGALPNGLEPLEYRDLSGGVVAVRLFVALLCLLVAFLRHLQLTLLWAWTASSPCAVVTIHPLPSASRRSDRSSPPHLTPR